MLGSYTRTFRISPRLDETYITSEKMLGISPKEYKYTNTELLPVRGIATIEVDVLKYLQ